MSYKDVLKKEGDEVTFSRMGTVILFTMDYGLVSVYITNQAEQERWENRQKTIGFDCPSPYDPSVCLANEATEQGAQTVKHLWDNCTALTGEWLTRVQTPKVRDLGSKCELLLAWDDRTWTTIVVKLQDSHCESSDDEIVEWWKMENLNKPAYQRVVLVGMHTSPGQAE